MRMNDAERSALQGRWVHFRIRDVSVPDPSVLLTRLYGGHLLQGRIVDFSEAAPGEGSYAVVAVEGMEEPVVLPVERILGAL